MRQFGVEFELMCPAAHRGNALHYTANLIMGLGFRARADRDHTANDYTLWQCKYDGSLEPRDRAVEAVSPILPPNPSSYDLLGRVVGAIDSAGFIVNDTCGMHVHVGVADLSVLQRQLVVLRFAKIFDDLMKGLPSTRRHNTYCVQLAPHDQQALERAIDTGGRWGGAGGHFMACNTQHMLVSDPHLEFRHAAATHNVTKALMWVKLLQEIMDEVVRRAATARFGTPSRPAPPSIAPIPPPTRNPLAMVPRMRESSDAYRALQQLCQHGVVTTAWAEEHGIGAHVLRRIVTGFRRHGAVLETVSTVPRSPNYVLVGVRALPVTAQQIFTGNPITNPPVPVVTPPPVPEPAATTTAAAFVRYDLLAGVSADVAAWWQSRVNLHSPPEDDR